MPRVEMSWYDQTDSTKELDDENDSEHDCQVDLRMEDDVDALSGIDLDRIVDMERHGDDE